MALKDKILNCDDLKKETLRIDQWGVSVVVRELNAKERSWVFEILEKYKNDPLAIKEMDAKVAIKCLLDEEGSPVFEEKDLPELLKKSGQVISDVLDVVWRLSGFDDKKKDSPQSNDSNLD